jgi:hypothetical protein
MARNSDRTQKWGFCPDWRQTGSYHAGGFEKGDCRVPPRRTDRGRPLQSEDPSMRLECERVAVIAVRGGRAELARHWITRDCDPIAYPAEPGSG